MKRLVTLIIIVIVIIGGAFLWWETGKQPVNSSDKSQKLFVVSKGEGVRDIGYNLKNAGLIKSPVVFFLIVKQLGLDGKIQAGDFRLSPSESADQIAESLTHGALDIWVTIPEGVRATEIAETFAQKLPTYDNSWKDALVAQEGYLFPDTYLIPHDVTVDSVITIMKNNFNQKYATAQQMQTANLTQQQAVILASIIQREAITPSDMRLVASVLENRLAIGMPLGSDVTLEYALGYQPTTHTWWKKDLTVDDLALQSPYNTRLNAGLPPTPISNPGIVALEAALNPTKSNYLYYVSDSNGKLHFATTIEQHNANVAKYLPQ